MKPAPLGDTFSTLWTRQAINNVVSKGVGHITQVTEHILCTRACADLRSRVINFGMYNGTGNWRCSRIHPHQKGILF